MSFPGPDVLNGKQETGISEYGALLRILSTLCGAKKDVVDAVTYPHYRSLAAIRQFDFS